MTNENIRFNINLPSEWEDQTVYSFRGPQIGETHHMMTLMLDRQLQYDEITEFAREKINPLTEGLQGLEVLKDEEVTIDDGNPAYEFVCRWLPSDEIQIIKKYVYVIYDGMGFTFNCDFTKKTYKLLGGQMKQIVESILPGTYEPLEED